MLAQVLREVYANNQFLLFRRLTPAQYFPSRHAGTPRITSCLRRNFRRNVHGFQSGLYSDCRAFCRAVVVVDTCIVVVEIGVAGFVVDL